MAYNQSAASGGPLVQVISERVIIVQVLVIFFLYINCLMITTFFMKDVFYGSMRYIFFVGSLISDCLFLIITNILLILSYFIVRIQMWLCFIIYIVSSLLTFVTPFTLTAMTLERYVAICMPLRHTQLCSPRSALRCILVINALSFIPCVIMIIIVFMSVSVGFYRQYTVCSVEIFIILSWQEHLRSAINQLYFLVMFFIIVFSYIKIMRVAKAASAENKKASQKGLQTVLLHTFQLIFCLTRLWCPLVETAILQINVLLFINVRYFNYIMFILVPRCLSPLIYGLRDEKFYQTFKYTALCGLYKKKVIVEM